MHARPTILLTALLLLLCCIGCGGPVVVQLGGSSAATGTTNDSAVELPAATAPATLLAVSPTILQAGTELAILTLSGTEIGAGAVVHMDGVAHTAILLNSTTALVVLTGTELAMGQRHTFTIQNAGLAESGSKVLLVTEDYRAYGDSITYGAALPAPATGNYASLLAADYGLNLLNSARGGDQACDVWRQVYSSHAGYEHVGSPLFSLMVGTNDVDVKGTGAYQAIFHTCDLAVLSWLGTPRQGKVLAGDASVTATGGCTNTAAAVAFGGILCTGASGTITTALVTSGNPVYVWYLLNDDAAASDGVTLMLDGMAAGTYTTQPIPRIATQNGSTAAVGVVRIAAAAGPHTVRISTTGLAGVLGVGSNPAAGLDQPRILVGDLPNQAYGTPVATVADQLAYNADILDVESLLLADGMDLHRASTRDYMAGTVFEMADQLHPNALGQQELSAAFKAALP